MTKKTEKHDPVWLDAKSQAARAGRSWLTLCRWMDDPEVNYPKPERYFKKTPVTRLETIEAWENAQPTTSPFKGIQRRKPEAVVEAS